MIYDLAARKLSRRFKHDSHTYPLIMDVNTSRIMDWLRGASSLAVLVVHAVQVYLLPYFGMGSWVQLGTSLLVTYAVMVFFVVSGFMISTSVQRHQWPNGQFDAIGFLAARLLRIYPPLLTAVALTIVVYTVIHSLDLHGAQSYRLEGDIWVARERATLEWHFIPSTLLLLYNVIPGVGGPINLDGPLWTLSYEYWLYLLTLFAANATLNRRILMGVVPLLAIVAVIIWSRNQIFIIFAFIWLGGYLLGQWYQNGLLFVDRYPTLALLVVLFALLALTAMGRTGLETLLLNPLISLEGLTVLWIICILLTVLLSIVLRRVHGRVPAIKTGWLCRAAKFSYTLYLVHYPLLMLGFSIVHPITHGSPWHIAAVSALPAVIGSVILASLLARIVEDRSRVRSVLTQVLTAMRVAAWR